MTEVYVEVSVCTNKCYADINFLWLYFINHYFLLALLFFEIYLIVSLLFICILVSYLRSPL